jgi:flavin reductase (DIM6/NTAB) family NADH-FMN oxidoreductase RutF
MKREKAVFYWLPCSVVFVSTAHGGKRDIMTATAMFVSEKDPIVVVSVAKGHLTDQLIQASEEFSLVIASEKQKGLAEQIGRVKGDEGDKFENFNIITLPSDAEKPLIPEDSSAWMSCKVVSSQEVVGYNLYVARVVDEEDLGTPPMVWQKDNYWGLKSI